MSVTSRVAVVMTDGNSNVDSARTVPEAVALHQAGVHVITVSTGRMYNETELRAIATRNGTVGNVLHADSYDELDQLASAVHHAICNGQSVTNPSPSHRHAALLAREQSINQSINQSYL